jgi:hypothetical protein
LIHILSKLVQVEVSFFLGEEATQEAKTRQSIFCSKNHQILPKLAVSQQNKTYVVTLMLRVVVGAVSKTRTILIIDLTPFSIRNPRCQSDNGAGERMTNVR